MKRILLAVLFGLLMLGAGGMAYAQTTVKQSVVSVPAKPAVFTVLKAVFTDATPVFSGPITVPGNGLGIKELSLEFISSAPVTDGNLNVVVTGYNIDGSSSGVTATDQSVMNGVSSDPPYPGSFTIKSGYTNNDPPWLYGNGDVTTDGFAGFLNIGAKLVGKVGEDPVTITVLGQWVCQ